MDGFLTLVMNVVIANGLADAQFHQRRSALTLPGYFRPTKLWDLLITCRGELIFAIELKSQVGPSFGNNFNNRAEEAIGTAHDFWVAYREGAFGKQPLPFVARLILVEDAPESRAPVKTQSPHFHIFDAFEAASYLDRYDLLCQRLVQEKLYSTATLLASSRTARENGQFVEMSEMTGLRVFVSALAGHAATTAARFG